MQNTPAMIPTIVRAMAHERNEDLAELCSVLSANTERVFGSFA
jgi:TatD DNase family protein